MPSFVLIMTNAPDQNHEDSGVAGVLMVGAMRGEKFVIRFLLQNVFMLE